MVSGVTLDRKWMYSSVWKVVIASGLARFGFWGKCRKEWKHLLHFAHQYVHLLQHPIRHGQLMRHTHPVWFHEMAESIGVCTNIRYR